MILVVLVYSVVIIVIVVIIVVIIDDVVVVVGGCLFILSTGRNLVLKLRRKVSKNRNLRTLQNALFSKKILHVFENPISRRRTKTTVWLVAWLGFWFGLYLCQFHT
jgi:hypothetical protein